jgi:hypothetical protein
MGGNCRQNLSASYFMGERHEAASRAEVVGGCARCLHHSDLKVKTVHLS